MILISALARGTSVFLGPPSVQKPLMDQLDEKSITMAEAESKIKAMAIRFLNLPKCGSSSFLFYSKAFFLVKQPCTNKSSCHLTVTPAIVLGSSPNQEIA